MSATISFDSVSRSYGNKAALTNINTDIETGTVHCLLGPNGAGKTTMLRLAAGLVAPSTGQVTVLGGDPYLRSVRTRIGWVPSDDRSFYMRISGRENLLFFARLYGLGREQGREVVDRRIEEVGLADAATKSVGEYSHGMTKRLAVARALLVDSPVILVDEATHDLDIDGSKLVRRLFRERADAGATVVWSTHRLGELVGLVDRVTVLDRGTTRFDGSMDDLIASADRPVYRVRLRSRNGVVTPDRVAASVGANATVVGGQSNELSLQIHPASELGDALRGIMDAGMEIISCNEESDSVERALQTKLRP